MSFSCIVMPSAKFRDTHTSFFNNSGEKKKTISDDNDSSSSKGTESASLVNVKRPKNKQQYLLERNEL